MTRTVAGFMFTDLFNSVIIFREEVARATLLYDIAFFVYSCITILNHVNI